MIINVPMRSKQDRIEPIRCEVVCAVEIPYDAFIRFRDNPLTDQDFIKEHLDELQPKDYSTASCLLVIGKDQSDGILVDPQGYSYARYTAYIPEARQLLQREQSRARVAAKAVRRDGGWKLFFDRLTGRGDAAVLSGLAHE